MKRLLAIFLLLASFSAHAQQSLSYIPIAQQTFTASSLASGTYSNYLCTGAQFVVSLPTYTSGNVTVHIQGYAVAAGQWYDLLVSPPISSVASTPAVMTVARGATILASWSTSQFLPGQWRVYLVGASTPSMTISIDANCVI